MRGGEPEALWLATMQRISGLAAHEVRGALNGVAVNLEVVRSRSEQPDAPAFRVASFAEAASTQLDAVIAMTEALLALARPAREPVDVGRVVREVGTLLVPVARADGRTLSMTSVLDDAVLTSAPASAVRAIVGECLLAAATGSGDAACRLVDGEPLPTVRTEQCDGSALQVGSEIVAMALAAGIQIVAEFSAITIRFPRSGVAGAGIA